MSDFQVVFANDKDVFQPCDLVEGHVALTLQKPMTFRVMTLKCKGRTMTCWTEGSSKHEKSYVALDKFFKEKKVLCGTDSDEGSNTVELQQGTHSFPFSFQLPEEIPSSFEGSKGSVHYSVSCVIQKAWHLNQKTKRMFTVNTILDLNRQPLYNRQCLSQRQKHYGCCLWSCCAPNTIDGKICIDRQGWVPGETIRCSGQVTNKTSRRIGVSVKLYLQTKFRDEKYHSHLSWKRIARVTRPSLRGHGTETWTNLKLTIPPTTPSFLLHCKLIETSYTVELCLKTPGCTFSLNVPIPIVIGTVPLSARSSPRADPIDYGDDSIICIAPGLTDLTPMSQFLSGIGLPSTMLFHDQSEANDGCESPRCEASPPSYDQCVTRRYAVPDVEDGGYTTVSRQTTV